jgi:hypothetical protein
MTGWIARRKVWLAIVVPYVALAISVVAVIGVYTTRADQAELRATAAQLRADTANDRAQRALELQAASCLDRQQARQDGDEILLTIAAALPVATGETLRNLISARPPIDC